MSYRSVNTPGSSITIQAILPGMLNRESMEGLPMGYQVANRGTDGNYYDRDERQKTT